MLWAGWADSGSGVVNLISPNFEPFQGTEHQPFRWDGGQSAALLVHGFPGTPAEMRPLPAEMRPLGKALHHAGWTISGLLLPGFGAQMKTIFDRSASDWVAAVRASLAELQQKYEKVLLIGYSMGAALAIQVAVDLTPAGLVLLAPYWQLGTPWQRIVGRLLKPFLRQFRPLKKADFSNPKLQRNLANFFSEVDLDDPETQQVLRDLQIPVDILGQLDRVGQVAYRLAPQVALPTLIVQGTTDETVPPDRTRRLLQRFTGPVRYEEVVAGHDMVSSDDPGWPQVERTVLHFARTFQAEVSAIEAIQSQ